MRLRTRKFIGTIALFVLVIVWALVAMAVAQSPAIRDNSVTSVVYYIVAGLGWVVPAMPLVWWMSRPEGRNQASGVRHQESGTKTPSNS